MRTAQGAFEPTAGAIRGHGPRIEVCDVDVVAEFPNHSDRPTRVDKLAKAALAQMFAIAEVRGKRLMPGRRKPRVVRVDLVDYLVGGLGEGTFRIVDTIRHQAPLANRMLSVGRFCFFNSATYASYTSRLAPGWVKPSP